MPISQRHGQLKARFLARQNMIRALQMELRNTLKSESRNEPGTAVTDTDKSIQQTSDGGETPTKDTKKRERDWRQRQKQQTKSGIHQGTRK